MGDFCCAFGLTIIFMGVFVIGYIIRLLQEHSHNRRKK